jgi:hypothetical protein
VLQSSKENKSRKTVKLTLLLSHRQKAALKSRYVKGRSIEMNQTALISLQVPYLSNSTRQKHTQRYTTLGATPCNPASKISQSRTNQAPDPNRVPAAGEALSRQSKHTPQEGNSRKGKKGVRASAPHAQRDFPPAEFDRL